MKRVFALTSAMLVSLSLAHAQPREDRGAAMGQFDLYVLALSWSATFCDLKGNSRGSRQCDGGRNPGFVLHGLWPQYERGYPAFCGPDGRNPSRTAMDKAERIFPDNGLARHQWRKHGVCSGLSPDAYFEASGAARAKIKVPDALQAPRAPRSWSILDIERSFVEANPGLRTDMIAVTCQRGMLQEVRVCLTKDLRSFRPCVEVDRDSCRAREVSVPAAQ